MNTKPFPTNPFAGRILVVAIAGSVGYLLGVAAILLVRPNGMAIGLVILLATTIAEVALVLRALFNVPCPGCGRLLRRDRPTGALVCDRCATHWTLPASRG